MSVLTIVETVLLAIALVYIVALLRSHAVVQAQAKDYVRRSQERLIAQPLLEQLRAGKRATKPLRLDGDEQFRVPGNLLK